MAVSGSKDWTLTAREVMTQALREANLVPKGQAAPAEDITAAQEQLERMLKAWTVKFPRLGLRFTSTFSTVIGQASYTLTDRPRSITTVQITESGGNERPLVRMELNTYRELTTKSTSGTPSQFFFDRQRDSSVMTLWPVPDAVQTVTYGGHARVDDVDDPANNLDIEQEYLDAVVLGLAQRLLTANGVTGERAADIRMRAQEAYEDMVADTREGFVQFTNVDDL